MHVGEEPASHVVEDERLRWRCPSPTVGADGGVEGAGEQFVEQRRIERHIHRRVQGSIKCRAARACQPYLSRTSHRRSYSPSLADLARITLSIRVGYLTLYHTAPPAAACERK